jgi:phosphoglycolate phosphatase-like HAD superfamily hydrolase
MTCSTDTSPTAVLFDIDGTLITTGGAGAVAWRMAFHDLYGVHADIGDCSDAGMTDPEVARRTFHHVIGSEPSARELARLMAVRLEYLPGSLERSEGYRVMPGVLSLLPALTRAGYLVGLTTGGVEAAARFKLAPAGLNRYFSFGGFGSDSPDRATLTGRAIERAGELFGAPLAPGRCLVVGDTPLDIAAAHANGAVAVGVASGRFSACELRAAGADHVLETLLAELPL